MRGIGLVLGLAMLGASPAACAEDVVTAKIDAAGRVVPSLSSATQQIAAMTNGEVEVSPCPAAKPLDPEEARGLVARVAAREGFQPALVLSVAKIESRYVSTALSPKGAYGLMQLMPDTAKQFEVDLCDPEDNVRGGIGLLRTLSQRYRNPLHVLAAYNAGEGPVRRARGVPAYPETVRFVADVLNDLEGLPAQQAESPTLGRNSDDIPQEAAANAALPVWTSGFVMHIQ